MTIYHTTLRGQVGSGNALDEFSHSLGIQSNSTELTVATDIVASWKTFWSGGGGGIDAFYAPSTQYLECTVARVIDPMVPDLGAATHVPFTPPSVGISIAEPLPQQTAIAVSLIAGTRPNGVPFRGRFYMPAPTAIVLTPEGLLDTVQRDALALRVQEHFARLKALGHTPSVWSRTVEDLVNAVTEVRVGDKLDTIRSRRNQTREIYSSRPV